MATKQKKIYNWSLGRGLIQNGLDLTTETYCILEEVFELNGYDVKSNKWFRRTLKPVLTLYIMTFRLTGLLKKVKITEDTINDASMDIVVFATQIPYKQGYDADLCLDETIKEISSRTGAINESTGKFEKDKSPEAVKRWYKAKYHKCKLGE